MTISRAQVKSSRVLLSLRASNLQVVGFRVGRGLNLGYYSGGEGGNCTQRQSSAQIKP